MWLPRMLKVARSILAEATEIYTRQEALKGGGGTADEGGGRDQSIGSTVSDAIVRSWLWSIAIRSSPLC